jgi:hypothetical protein
MSEYKKWDRELKLLEQGKSQYSWDEIEELITDCWDDENITDEQFEALMRRLMDIDCER